MVSVSVCHFGLSIRFSCVVCTLCPSTVATLLLAAKDLVNGLQLHTVPEARLQQDNMQLYVIQL